MKEIHLKSESDFFNIFKKYQKSTLWKYRGQSVSSWKLISKSGRPPYTKFDDKLLFELWAKRAMAYLDYKGYDKWELLSIAQHTGLPTRLLDWSHNPLVAAFFAVSENYSEDGAVYASKMKYVYSDVKYDPFSKKIDKVLKYFPNSVSPRIINQSGYFTYHPNPTEEMTEKNFDGSLEKIIIPKELKKQILHSLNQFNINYLSIYPDLEGLSKHLSWHVESVDYWRSKTPELEIEFEAIPPPF